MPRRWRRMEVKEEFGSAPGEEEARRAKQNVFFFCPVFVLFPLFGGSGEMEIRVPYCRRNRSLCSHGSAGIEVILIDDCHGIT